MADKTKGKQDRVSAPMATKHMPALYDPVWNLLVPDDSKKVVSIAELNELEMLQKPHFFGASGKMKAVDWEPDCLGCLRVFTAGKVRMQLFRASDLSTAKDTADYQTSTKNLLIRQLNQQNITKDALPKSTKAVIDCGSGPVVIGIPPGYLVVQEAVDTTISSGVRRSFTPKGKDACVDFELAVSSSFKLKDKMLAAAVKAD